MVNLILYLPSLNQQIAMWLTNQTDLYYYLHMGIGSDAVLYDVLVGFNAQMVRQALVDANGTTAIFNWFYNNSQQQVLQFGAKHAHGLVSAWQTAQAPQSMAAYFGFVQQYYGQSAYDFILQLYQAASKTYLDSFNLSEWHIYGSARLGIYQTYLNLVTAKFNANAGSGGIFTEVGYGSAIFATVNYQLFSLQRGEKVYELTNHLGNVLVTISDKRLPQCSATVVTGHTAYVISATDYSAFGAPLPGRTFAGEGYRYGFNGKEKDNEANGTGNAYDFGARNYDARLGRWLSCDPLFKKYPGLSLYNFSINSPIAFNDPDGRSPIYVNGLYMGTDNQGFNGEIITMTSDQYSKLNNAQKDNITMGTLNHTEAMGLGQTLGQKIDALKNVPMSKGGIRRVDKEVVEINMIINNVVSKTNDINGFEVDKLHNGSVSSVYDNGLVNTDERIYGMANDGNNVNAFANRKPGTNIITFNLQSWGSVEVEGQIANPTVANLQNTYVHEAGGHFAKNLSHKPSDHFKVIQIQKNHSTWKNTTPTFKSWLNKVQNEHKKAAEKK